VLDDLASWDFDECGAFSSDWASSCTTFDPSTFSVGALELEGGIAHPCPCLALFSLELAEGLADP
jgi:hypothetical protein